MKQTAGYSRWQTMALIVLRYLVGWHILYEGIAKLLNPQWSSLSFLQDSKGVLEGVAGWIISNPGVLNIVDFLNTWGLIAIGLGLLLGLLSTLAAMAGSLLIFIYYLNAPPLIGVEYILPADGNNLLVNKTLIEAAALFVLALFPTSRIFGFDAWLFKGKKTGKK
jgi:thiosulfate dehydrogenase [quinone] large subunit